MTQLRGFIKHGSDASMGFWKHLCALSHVMPKPWDSLCHHREVTSRLGCMARVEVSRLLYICPR